VCATTARLRDTVIVRQGWCEWKRNTMENGMEEVRHERKGKGLSQKV